MFIWEVSWKGTNLKSKSITDYKKEANIQQQHIREINSRQWKVNILKKQIKK